MATNVENKESETKEAGQPDEEDEKEKENANFECNICLDTAKDAVISMCGHLFCWACLHRWLETRAHDQTCPVCKAAISKEKVIPLYGRGSSNHTDPREKVPPRPAGQRTEPEPNNSFLPGFNFNDGGGMHFQFGIGAFPFALFTSFNHHGLFAGGHRGLHLPPGNNQRPEDRFLSTVFMAMAILFLLWLIVV